MIPIPNRRERLEQGALTLAALAAVTVTWLGIGLPSFPSLFSHDGRYENDAPVFASTDDPAQPRPHAAPSIPVGKNEVLQRQGRKPGPKPVRSSAIDRRTSATATAAMSAPKVAPSGAVQPRLETAATNRAAEPPPQAATTETPSAPEAAATTHTTATSTLTTSDNPTPPPPPPPVTTPTLPDLPGVPDVPDLPLPNVPPLPTVPPTPAVTVPELPPLPVEPPSQLPPVQVPTQTVPTLP